MLKTILKCILSVVLLLSFLAIYQPTGQQLFAFGMSCHVSLLLTLFFLAYENSRLQALQGTNTTTPVAAG